MPPLPPRWTERALTVAAFTQLVRDALEPRFRGVQVKGEVMGARAVQSGHLYFTLKDAGAQLPCVVWRTTLQRLPTSLKDGAHVVVTGDLQVHPPHGRYQMIVARVVDVGLGERLAELEALKRRLEAEGLFAPERKRPLPVLPRRVGLVTAASGAALHDLTRTIFERWPADVVLYPCKVQGDLAASGIADAVRALGRVPGVDVIVLARGGGSQDDLWVFNHEAVVRTVAHSVVPIVSAVGHEIDWVLCDLAADRRAATPTAAGAMVVPDHAALSARVDEAAARMQRAVERLVAERRQARDERLLRLERAWVGRLTRLRARLDGVRDRLHAQHPHARMGRQRLAHARLEARLVAAIQRQLGRARQRLDLARRGLEALSPTSSLDRGYTIVRRVTGEVVRSAAQVQVGDLLDITTSDGHIQARTEGTTPRERSASEVP
ncbi:MAG: exodeoxyribonuclease VII large subunit [Deltaproteobacteria bacterium]|nr:exodeoxyribonuclease VII large subunit [Deltaproteobacteria bacterium]